MSPIDDLEDELGISFGLGIDIEALHDSFKINSACGGQEEDRGSPDPEQARAMQEA